MVLFDSIVGFVSKQDYYILQTISSFYLYQLVKTKAINEPKKRGIALEQRSCEMINTGWVNNHSLSQKNKIYRAINL
jgi:hypothetical protein